MALEITEEMRSAANQIALELGVCGELHEDDYLLNFFVNKRGRQVGTEGYFKGGRTDAAKVVRTLKSLKIDKEPLKILDFAAGYGRVARHVKSMLPNHDLYASDIHPQACTFLQDQLEIPSYPSSFNPSSIEVGREYDFIYVLSLFLISQTRRSEIGSAPCSAFLHLKGIFYLRQMGKTG